MITTSLPEKPHQQSNDIAVESIWLVPIYARWDSTRESRPANTPEYVRHPTSLVQYRRAYESSHWVVSQFWALNDLFTTVTISDKRYRTFGIERS